MSETRRWLVSIVALMVLLGLTYQIMRGFLAAVLWAVVLVYVTWPLYRRVSRACGERAGWAALAMTVLLASVVVIPVVLGTVVLQREVADFLRELPGWLLEKPRIPRVVLQIPLVGEELARRLEQFDDVQSVVTSRALPWLRGVSDHLFNVLQELGRNLATLGFTALTMFFVYRDGAELVRQLRAVLLNSLGERANDYLVTAESTTKAVVYGIVLTALGQGAIAGIGYAAVGLKAPILLTLVTMLFAMIPFGTPLVWGAASVWLLIEGHQWAGVTLALWGALAVSWVDNVIRPLVISANTRIPFPVVLFGVLGGLVNYGFIGLFVGPVILAIALAVWREWVARAAGVSDHIS